MDMSDKLGVRASFRYPLRSINDRASGCGNRGLPNRREQA
jgi:hypothetical protein